MGLLGICGAKPKPLKRPLEMMSPRVLLNGVLGFREPQKKYICSELI